MKTKYGLAHTISKTDKNQKLWAKQRRERGFDDTELWNLDFTIAQFVIPRLRALKDLKIGYPIDLTMRKWHNALDKIILAFEECLKDDADEKLVKDGLKLFVKYYRNLWD